MLLRAEKKDAGIGCKNGPVFGFEKVAGILADQDQTAAVLANASSESDKETTDGLVLEEQAHLIDKEMARPAIATECRPEPVGEQQARGRNELLAQVAEVEPDDRCTQVNVR